MSPLGQEVLQKKRKASAALYNDAMTPATNSPDFNVILAAGGVLCRLTPSRGDEILVVHRKRYGDWTLPKGKVKPGKSFAAAALREVAEETGCSARFEDYLGSIGYAVKGVPKAVQFWRMSLIEHNEIADHEEVAEVLWMPAAAAIQRLTHSNERTLALRARPELLETPPQRLRRWLSPQHQDYSRLQREFDSFSIELAVLEARSQQSDKSWAAAAHGQLGNVAHYLKKRSKDVEGGWVCLHAARRHAIHGLGAEELPMQASMLRAEATKLSGWRARGMQNLLSVKDEQLTAVHITNAMTLRDEYSSNQYQKIWLLGDQLALLLIITCLGLFLLVPLIVFYSWHPEGMLAAWGV